MHAELSQSRFEARLEPYVLVRGLFVVGQVSSRLELILLLYYFYRVPSVQQVETRFDYAYVRHSG